MMHDVQMQRIQSRRPGWAEKPGRPAQLGPYLPSAGCRFPSGITAGRQDTAFSPLREQLLSLAEDATQRSWWDDYADVLAPEYLEFIGLEAEAVSIAAWHSDVVPGLLQTEDYARQISLGYQSVIPTPPSAIEQRVRVRMTRQE